MINMEGIRKVLPLAARWRAVLPASSVRLRISSLQMATRNFTTSIYTCLSKEKIGKFRFRIFSLQMATRNFNTSIYTCLSKEKKGKFRFRISSLQMATRNFTTSIYTCLSKEKNGKLRSGERKPSEKYFFRGNHWKTPAWGRIINGKFLFV
jgi:hypothetical protein